jgi:5-methylcytosine-specific restriction protein A
VVERLRGRAAVAQRKRRLARTHGLCERCSGLNRWHGQGTGRVSVATVVNHIIPLAHGGSDEDDNTENLCRECDLIVTAEQFGYRAPKRQIGRDGWPT